MNDREPFPPGDASAGSRRAIVLLSITVFLYWASMYLYASTLPTYVESKTNSLALAGVVLSMYGLWQALLRLPLGIAADWLGRRKPFIVGGLVLAALGAWMLGTADRVGALIAGRAVTGLAAATWVPLLVAFTSLFRPEETVRAAALLTFIGSAARTLSTAINGSLNEWGGYSLAFMLAAGAAAVAILVMLPVSESARPSRRPSPARIGRLIRRRDVLAPSLVQTIWQYVNWATTFSFVPVMARQLGATDVGLSLLLSMNIAVITVGNLATTTIIRLVGTRRLTLLSLTFLVLGTAGMALAPSLAWVFAAQFCIGLSMGAGYPLFMGLSIRHVAEEERATAMGLHQAAYAVGMFTGPWLSGLLADAIGLRPMFGVTGAVCLLLGGVVLWGRRGAML